jgi:DNA-binding NarL/FixJ family response regulator
MPKSKITIALIDDHDLFREGIKLVLNQIDDFEVIYDTSNGNHFIEYLKTTMPDITLMDISMPIIDGVETTKKSLEICSGIKIIALTMFSDTVHCSMMINAGVKGFIQKKATKPELHQAITDVFKGGNYFSQEIIKQLAFKTVKHQLNEELTTRENYVLNLVCKGHTSQEIAEKLFISIKTVEVHRTNIFRKANTRNIAELIIWAVKNNHFSFD